MTARNPREKIQYGNVYYYPEELDLVKRYRTVLSYYGIRPDITKVPRPYLYSMYLIETGEVLYYGESPNK